MKTKSLFAYLLEKRRSSTSSFLEEKVMKFYLQANLLLQYFDIASQYCTVGKIQGEVEELFPSWTGYENYYWYCYHYEAFGNALYAYTKAYESIFNFLKKRIKNFSNEGDKYLSEFINDNIIAKILKDRHDSVHQFGAWRSEISEELIMQDWKNATLKIASAIINARNKIRKFDPIVINFINDRIQEQDEY